MRIISHPALWLAILFGQACKGPEAELPQHILEQPLEISALNEKGETLIVYKEGGSDGGTLQLEKQVDAESEHSLTYTYTIHAKVDMDISLQKDWTLASTTFEEAEFLLPGFWYKRNLRSPEKAPSFKTADFWSFREDRLSAPLAVGYNPNNGQWVKLERRDSLLRDEKPESLQGNIRLLTDIGSLGIGKGSNQQTLLRGNFPFLESPSSYQSKLKLNPEWMAFYPLKKGEKLKVSWTVSFGKAARFSDMVKNTWETAYDHYKPSQVENTKTDIQIKEVLSNYFYESYAETKDLKGFAGLWFDTKTCKNTGVLSVGFCGKTFANAYNLLEYGVQQNNSEHIALARKVLDSYYANGFTSTGLIRELVYGTNAEDVYTLRKQSEGLKNLLFLLDFDKRQGIQRATLEQQIKTLMHRLVELQDKTGGFPRKFDANFKVLDNSTGSTQSIITPMVMAARYFNEPEFMKAAVMAGSYAEKNIIEQSDYFSSTLDANCEDKEAAAIAAVSFYHLALAADDASRQKYVSLAKEAAYFGLSWYYLWDVPFPKESLLGRTNLKTRGWGNVSTENNHIDVWAFDFPHVLEWLARETDEPRFSEMAKVITSSIKDQMLPYEGHMVGVGKVGYMPEIIQHTVWDYGANGKGYLNAHMSVGWTVASIWEVLTPGRFGRFLERYP